MRVSVCLGAILIPEYLDFQEQNSWNIFRNIFLFRSIPNERALSTMIMKFLYLANINICCLSISINWIYNCDGGEFAFDSMMLIVIFREFATA